MKKQCTIFLILIFVLGLVPINFSNAADLATKLKGRILLQVESKGEAWYVHPTELKRYYMANGAEAYNIMRSLGIGITNANLTKLQNSTVQAKKHSGKIFLQVEANGEAFYVNSDGKLYYLKDGNAAYNVMRSLGLGITNKNLDTIKANTASIAESQLASEKKESDLDILKRQLDEQAAMIKALQEQQEQKAKEALLQPLTNKQIIDKVVPATVYIQLPDGSGSGMIIDSSGYILTNAHVVSGVNSAVIKMQDKRVFTGSVVGRDENVDIAIIKINAQSLPYVEFGNSDLLTAGDEVFALGFPLGLEGDASFKNGTVSRKFVESIATYIETSTEILPGNSGGPLVNKFGFVIGINTFGIESSAGSLKFAIAINTVKQYIDLLKAGRNEIKAKTTLPTTLTPTPSPASGSLARFTGNPYVSYTTFDTGSQYAKPNWHINFGVTFAGAKYASVNCRGGNYPDGVYYTKALKSGTSLDLRVQENGLVEGKSYYCEFYLNNVGENAGPLDLLRDSAGNLIFKSLSFTVPNTATESPAVDTSPTPQPNNIPLPEPNKVNVKITRDNVVEFNVYDADKPGTPLSVKTVVLSQTGTLADSDFEFVSYLAGGTAYNNVPVSGGKITVNYTPGQGGRILINPKIKASGLGKTLSLVIESIEVYLNEGDRQGEVVGLNQSSGYIAYPEQFIVIPAGGGNSALVQYCESKFTSSNPTYSWFNDNACVISN